MGNETTANLVFDLKAVGFTEYEARIYVEVLQAGAVPKTAYEIARGSGVPRSNTYSALDGLTRKGAVLPVTENPTSYAAANPRDVLGKVRAQTDKICERLETNLENLAPKVENQYVWMLRDEENIDTEIQRLIGLARDSIWIKAADATLRKYAAALEQAVSRESVSLLVVLFGTDKSEFEFNERCKVYIHENDGSRMGKADNLFTLAIDHKEMITVNRDHELIAARTQSLPIVTMALSLIRHDYYMSEIFRRFGDQLNQEFGRYLVDLRKNAYTPDQLASFYEKMELKKAR
ncbi:hypothetical protein KVP10_15815 [Candidimonas humi]|jgi:sugar-specific transcriptional regulator TrmB|uniref:TrmB family transcriptional regulator n=1 Tax=Candidimonas humi TaxID=683355 RepID=A0ABV8P0B1_9BURK|nr:helix-turn-helix domain-containing protein [Candidimonas humi]MBV6306359.1 hypothetical protein [Candidimonas humi]